MSLTTPLTFKLSHGPSLCHSAQMVAGSTDLAYLLRDPCMASTDLIPLVVFVRLCSGWRLLKWRRAGTPPPTCEHAINRRPRDHGAREYPREPIAYVSTA